MLNQTALFFHFVSLLIVGGGMIALILAERRLWKELNTGPDHPGIWIEVIQSATRFILVAIAAFFISGLVLLYSTNWVYLQQPWFIVKFACFLLFTVSGALIGGKTVEFIDKQFQEKNYDMDVLIRAKAKMSRFHIIQFILVVVIILLGTFRPF